MRGMILALLLALVGCAKSQNKRFLNPSKTYVYNYEGITVSGMPDNSLSKTGLKLNLEAEISVFAQRTFILKVQNIDISEYNNPSPRNPFTRSTKLTQAIAEQIKHPFMFEYQDGRVGDVFAAEGVSTTVVNIIRGILNLIQVNVRNPQNVYDVEEDCISGRCPTRYLIQKEDKKSNTITVIKSRDLGKCEDRAVHRFGMIFLEPCRECQQKSENLRGMLACTYRIRNETQGAVIEEVKAKEVFQESLFHELYGAAVTEIRQLLTLKEIKSRSVNVQLENRGGLKYQFGSEVFQMPLHLFKARQVRTLKEIKSSSVNESLVQLENRGGLKYQFGREVFQMPFHLFKAENIEAQVSDTLQHLAQNNQQEVQAEAPAKFLKLIQLLRDLNPDNIQAILKQYSDKPLYWQWLAKAIPLIGTAESLKVVRHNIPNQSTQEAAMSITLALQHTRASQNALQVAAELLEDSRVQNSPVLHKAAMLSYGTMVNKFCATTQVCPESALQLLHDFAAEAASKARTEEMSTAMKAIGNAGQVSSIQHLMKSLPGFSSSANQLPVRVQVDAVMALRNIAKNDPRRVEEILLSILMNRRTHTEVRMMAAAVLMESRPSAATVTTMAQAIQKETKVNLQLASFVYSYMKAFTKAAAPENRELRESCNIAIKIMNPMLDKLSMRYSKAFNLDMFNYPLMAGATANVLVMNSPTTTLPTAIIFKLRGYAAGASTDIIEFGVRAEGLQEVLRKQNIPFNQYSMQKNIVKIIKSLTGFKSLPSELPLVSAYIKLSGQELFSTEVTTETIQNSYRIMTEPTANHSIINRIIKKLLNGLVGQWAQPILLSEIRQIQPTSMGLPLDLSVHSAAVGNAAVNLNMKLNPTSSSDLSVAQLLQSKIQFHADVTPSISVHTVASMGINTPLVQSGIEFRSNIQANTPVQFTAKFDAKEENAMIEFEPNQQEKDLIIARNRLFTVSRNVEELELPKTTPLVPKGAEHSIVQTHFARSQRALAEAASVMEGSSEVIAKKYAYPGVTGQHQALPTKLFHSCLKIPKVNLHLCLQRQSHTAAGHRHTFLYQILGQHEAKLTVKPTQKEVAIEKVQLEITAGPKAASKIIALADLEQKGGEHLEESEVQKRLRAILGIDDEYKHNNPKNSSSSSSSSSQQHMDRKHQQTDQQGTHHYTDNIEKLTGSLQSEPPLISRYINMFGQELFHTEHARAASAHFRTQFNSSSSSSSSSGSSSSESARRPQAIARFIGEYKSPSWVATLQAVQADNKKQGYKLTVYGDYNSSKPKLQAYVVDISGESHWRACIRAQIESQHEAQAELKWGQNCQQYKMAAWAETGHWGNQPALRLKVAWPRIPSQLKSAGREIGWVFPEAAFMFGFSEKVQRNPSRQAKVVLSLSTPRTLNVILQAPKANFYCESLNLPAAITAALNAHPEISQAPTWNMFADLHNLVADSLKGHCSMTENTIKTFNDINYNYTMPGHCYHVLAQDCTEENKFLIMAKNSVENPEHKDINIKLGEFDITMYSRSGEPMVKVNNIDISKEKLPYDPSQDPSVHIEKRDGKLVLSAPEFGIEELVYDRKSTELRTAVWMRGQTCGICGRHDDETEREFTMPDGSVAKDEDSFGHSWILSEDTCSGACKLHRSLVTTEKPEREENKCYSVHPVLRCAKGCTQSATTPVSVGFHCTSADLAEDESLIDRSEDFTEQVEAHTSCSCKSLKCAD